jgi:eRF1 domain 3
MALILILFNYFKLQRLQTKVIKLVDISYGGENGFNQAIELAAESLQNVKFIQEKKLIGRYFDEISQDTGKYCFGVEDTLRALELGSVETLICWENLDIQRYVLKNHASSTTTSVLHLTPEQEKDKSHFTDKEASSLNIYQICCCFNVLFSTLFCRVESKWNWLSRNLYWNGLRIITKVLALHWKSLLTNLKREASSFEDSVELVVSFTFYDL